MAHTYLLDLYTVLRQRRDNWLSAHGPENQEEAAIRRGRYEAAGEVLTFLRDNYHRRLPRRLQQEADKLLAEEIARPASGKKP